MLSGYSVIGGPPFNPMKAAQWRMKEVRMSRALPPTLYPVLFIHPWWIHPVTFATVQQAVHAQKTQETG